MSGRDYAGCGDIPLLDRSFSDVGLRQHTREYCPSRKVAVAMFRGRSARMYRDDPDALLIRQRSAMAGFGNHAQALDKKTDGPDRDYDARNKVLAAAVTIIPGTGRDCS